MCDAHVERAVVNRNIQKARRLLCFEIAEQGKSPADILVAASGADQAYVVLRIAGRDQTGDLLGQGAPPAPRRELQEAAIHDGVRFDAVGADVLQEVTGLIVAAARGVNFHESLVSGEGTHRVRTEIYGNTLGKFHAPGFGASGKERATKTLCEVDTIRPHLLEQLNRARVPRPGVHFQEGLVDPIRQCGASFNGDALHHFGCINVLTPATLADDVRNALPGKRPQAEDFASRPDYVALSARTPNDLRHRARGHVVPCRLHSLRQSHRGLNARALRQVPDRLGVAAWGELLVGFTHLLRNAMDTCFVATRGECGQQRLPRHGPHVDP
mmetsp:Transcript_82125/g.228924  ORF Transcript_82125/g.228924 Transcript_82125/m.228924 type:complete len:327 (-) Transcript_82125:751-1731(-)